MKVKKALHGLKQSPMAWYSRVINYFKENKLVRCPNKYTLYVKEKKNAGILIAWLYVVDLIFISDNLAMFDDFRKAIIQEFEMLDIRLMFYYLNIEIKQVQWNIFISQESYAKKIFNEFNMKSCKPMNIPVECGAKSSKHEDGEKINPILFRRLIGILSFLTCTPRQDIFFLELQLSVIL